MYRDDTVLRLSLPHRYESRMKELTERFQKKEEQLQKEVHQHREGLKALLASSQEDEVALRRKKKRLETEVGELVGQYDETRTSSEQEYQNSLKSIRTEQRELAELELHFAKLDAEANRQAREKDMEDLRHDLIRKEKERLGECASFVQAFWRGLVGREEFIKLRKSKKGKQGGKKGKK